jgi:hypothetical protein
MYTIILMLFYYMLLEVIEEGGGAALWKLLICKHIFIYFYYFQLELFLFCTWHAHTLSWLNIMYLPYEI